MSNQAVSHPITVNLHTTGHLTLKTNGRVSYRNTSPKDSQMSRFSNLINFKTRTATLAQLRKDVEEYNWNCKQTRGDSIHNLNLAHRAELLSILDYFEVVSAK